jgi:hypothetical protein
VKHRTIVNVATGALTLAGTGLIYLVFRKPATKKPGAASPLDYTVVPPPPDALWLRVSAAPQGAVDVSAFLAERYTAAHLTAAEVTVDQRARMIAAFTGMGVDPQGFIRWRPTLLGQEAALALADQFDREKAPPVLGAALRQFVSLAATLPVNPLLAGVA